ncbi:hypothetical protein Micbo1qcDRAFT_220479 [Microdochium bolleyi]|uniref:DUF7580 domain-containing protein n=1 Tax=Microdochium bolleyi TaxID=196109 RepID=A0A136J9N3_9PEZI|nr:hypothetical protein Micbo1qcDRAFT_220479 [Microdochium bolleyi]
MEVAGLAVGVLPVLGVTVKAYKSVRSKGLGHFPREIRLLRGSLSRQYYIFLQESHLLMRAAIHDEERTQRMIHDLDHEDWYCEELETALRQLLKNGYEVYLSAVKEVRAAITDLEAGLSEYERLSSHRQKGEKIQETARRISHHVKIVWTKDDFNKTIASLRELNGDLERLRRQACDLLPVDTTSAAGKRTKSKLSHGCGSYQSIQHASSAFHHVLQTLLSCGTSRCATQRTRHQVKLLTNAKREVNVHMEICFSCEDANHSGLQRESPWRSFQIQSRELQWIESAPPTPPSIGDDRAKRVRFEDDISTGGRNPAALSQVVPAATIAPLTPYRKSKKSNSEPGGQLCFKLKRETVEHHQMDTSSYLGYADNSSVTQPAYRHSFHAKTSITTASNCSGVPTEVLKHTPGLSTLSEALTIPAEHTISVHDQLCLARDIAVAFLRFYSTPWMGPFVTTQDFSFFKTASSELADYIPYLHLSSSFAEDSPSMSTDDTDMPDESVISAQLKHGLYSIPLWCLGTILLQIGKWESIPDTHDVVNIRRISAQAYAPGPRFQRLVERCLRCNFSFGDDLSKPRLQQEVHKKVVCELSEMIEILELKDSDSEG